MLSATLEEGLRNYEIGDKVRALRLRKTMALGSTLVSPPGKTALHGPGRDRALSPITATYRRRV